MHTKAERALKIWEEFVSLNHHKERDLRFLIVNYKSVYNTEDLECVAILNDPYIIDAVHSTSLWDKEDLAVIDMILQAFQAIRSWCYNVIENKEDYDEEQVEQALYYETLEKERQKLRRFLKKNSSHKLGDFTEDDYYSLVKH